MVAGEPTGVVPFQKHIELLEAFLAHRDEIVERIQELLNAQRRPLEYLQDRAALARQCDDCFFAPPAAAREQSALKGQLEEAHWASGFRPRRMPGIHNDLIDAAEMMIRAFHLWRQTRWPGRNGRVRYAQTLFNVYVLRWLELLIMRLWDDGSSAARERLTQIQGVLDRLWATAPSDQPALVRDARWLLPLAQSPTTDDLAPYFEVAKQIAGSLPEGDRIEINKASVQAAGGHLRSQLRHCSLEKGVPIDEHDLTLSTRNSNALDFAMLIQGLVPLLEAYERAQRSGDLGERLRLAGAICQGISCDPELFVNRTDLLGAYSMIEHLFVAANQDGAVLYTPMGSRHVELFERYAALMAQLSKPLHEDCAQFRPLDRAYSPYGVIYGFSSNLTEHMALKALQADATTRFALEDVFGDEQASAEKLAWVSGWRRLPHIGEEVQKLFAYPQHFAEDIFNRVERALRAGRSDSDGAVAMPGAVLGAVPAGRLHILSAGDPLGDSKTSAIAELPIRYIGSSDPQITAANHAHPCDEAQLLRDRQEGMFLVSYRTSGGWTAISKDVLTDVLGAGQDVKIVGLPDEAAAILTLMCVNLVAPPRS